MVPSEVSTYHSPKYLRILESECVQLLHVGLFVVLFSDSNIVTLVRTQSGASSTLYTVS
jgi:hypothetical protein